MGTRDAIEKIELTMAQWEPGFEPVDGVADIGHAVMAAVCGR